MKKNRVKSFATAISVVIFFFLFSIIFIAPQAHAYAIGSSSSGITPDTTGVSSSTVGTSYDFGSSLQNLISPFTGFINSLKFNTITTVNTNGAPGVASLPVINFTPVVASTIQNFLTQWFSQFDTWFYSVSGVQLSGILVAMLGVFSWALGLAQQAVNWLSGLFH